MTEALERLIAADVRLFGVTPESVAAALNRFPLKSARDMTWLARAIRGALYVSLGDPGETAANADIRDELFALANKAGDAWLALSQRSQSADNAIFDYTWHGWQDAPRNGDLAEPPEHIAFAEAVASLEGLSVFLRRAGMLLEVQRPNWRRADLREERIWRAQCLSVVFELAFPGHVATVVSHRLDGSAGNWPDFYQTVVGLAFGERATPDLKGVLKEARRRNKLNGVSFEAGILPD